MLLSSAVALAAAEDDGAHPYESVTSWNMERVRQVLASNSVDIIFIGDSWSVPHLLARPMPTFAREVDFADFGGLNGLCLSAVNAGFNDGAPFYRVQTGLSTTRLLGLSTGDYRYAREKYVDPRIYNGIPVGGASERRVEATTKLVGNSGYIRVTMDPDAMSGVNFSGNPLGAIGASTLFRFGLLAQPDDAADLIESVEVGTTPSYGGQLTHFNLHDLVETQSVSPMTDFVLPMVVPPSEATRVVTIWPEGNVLPSGEPIRYITLRNCGIIAADEFGAPLATGVTLRSFADSSYSLESLATDTPSTQALPKRYTTAQLLAWTRATRIKDHALVFVHFAVENGSQAEINAQLYAALDRLESVLPQAGYESFCIIPAAMAHMIAGRDYDTSMQRVREWNAEFLAAARARPQSTAFVNLFARSGEFMMVDGWRGTGDNQGLSIPPDNQQNWQDWLRQRGFDEFALWDGTVVDLSALPTLFDSGRLHVGSSAAATFFYRALLWDEILHGVTQPAELTSMTVVRGSLIDGGLEDLQESDDQRMRTRSVIGFTAQEPNIMEIRIGAETDVSGPDSLAVRIESRLNTPGGTARVRLRNWSTGQLDLVRLYPLAQTERTELIEGIAADEYVRESDGPDVELSLRHASLVTFSANGFDSFFDCVQIGVR